MLIANRHHLETVLGEYVNRYNGHRPHLSLGQGAPEPRQTMLEKPADVGPSGLRRTDRLGGVIHEYRLAGDQLSSSKVIFPDRKDSEVFMGCI
jgi:hypothetical protein